NSFEKKNPLRNWGAAVGAIKTDSKSERKQQNRDQISNRIDARAFLRIQILRACDFAVASIEDAVHVKKGCANYESKIIAANEQEKADHGKECDQPRPNVWRHRRSQKEPAGRARNRAIQITRDKTVARFAAAAKQPAFRGWNLRQTAEIPPCVTASVNTCIFNSLP